MAIARGRGHPYPETQPGEFKVEENRPDFIELENRLGLRQIVLRLRPNGIEEEFAPPAPVVVARYYRLRIGKYAPWGGMEPPQDAGRYAYRLLEQLEKTTAPSTPATLSVGPTAGGMRPE